MLRGFYAVTHTSVYFVCAHRSKQNLSPVATKVALRKGIGSHIAVGEELKNSMMIAITTELQGYVPEGGGITSYQR